jgi:hypothetical protein
MAPLSFDGSQPGTPVGHFTYKIAEDRWTWSDGLYELHGFAPYEVPATTGVLLSHKHPDDRIRTYEVLEKACRDGEPFSCYHRIIEVDLALARIAETRAVIDQAKGMLILATGCDEDAAFHALRTYSQNTNVKVRDVARLLVDAVDSDIAASADTRSTVLGFLESLR